MTHRIDDSFVLVRLDYGRGQLAYIDPTPIPLDTNGHCWKLGKQAACFLCEAAPGGIQAQQRCPEADLVEEENATLAAYAAQYRVGVTA